VGFRCTVEPDRNLELIGQSRTYAGDILRQRSAVISSDFFPSSTSTIASSFEIASNRCGISALATLIFLDAFVFFFVHASATSDGRLGQFTPMLDGF
jgi:hypothetical protein